MGLDGCSLTTGADFHHQRSDESDRADEDGDWNGDVFVSVGHVDPATTHHAIKHRANDTQKQPGAHASSGEQKRGEEHAYGRGKSDGELGAEAGRHGIAVRHT